MWVLVVCKLAQLAEQASLSARQQLNLLKISEAIMEMHNSELMLNFSWSEWICFCRTEKERHRDTDPISHPFAQFMISMFFVSMCFVSVQKEANAWAINSSKSERLVIQQFWATARRGRFSSTETLAEINACLIQLHQPVKPPGMRLACECAVHMGPKSSAWTLYWHMLLVLHWDNVHTVNNFLVSRVSAFSPAFRAKKRKEKKTTKGAWPEDACMLYLDAFCARFEPRVKHLLGFSIGGQCRQARIMFTSTSFILQALFSKKITPTHYFSTYKHFNHAAFWIRSSERPEGIPPPIDKAGSSQRNCALSIQVAISRAVQLGFFALVLP